MGILDSLVASGVVRGVLGDKLDMLVICTGGREDRGATGGWRGELKGIEAEGGMSLVISRRITIVILLPAA